MKWLQKKREEVLRRWKADKIGLAEAAAELTELGIPPLIAWSILQET